MCGASASASSRFPFLSTPVPGPLVVTGHSLVERQSGRAGMFLSQRREEWESGDPGTLSCGRGGPTYFHFLMAPALPLTLPACTWPYLVHFTWLLCLCARLVFEAPTTYLSTYLPTLPPLTWLVWLEGY